MVASSWIVAPTHTGPPLLAVTLGAGFTATVVQDWGETQPFTVTVTQNEPLVASCAFGIVGFWSVEVKPPGPVHE